MRKSCLLFMVLSLLLSQVASAEAINCEQKELSRVERKICQNSELKKLDGRFNIYYEQIKQSFAEDRFAKHKEWKLERSRCLTEKCIENLYQQLIKDALAVLSEINPKFMQMREECQSLNIPPECEVYAYDGSSADLNTDYAEFAIDPNYETHVKKIMVNRPQKCVVLALSSYEPTLWKIYFSAETQIYGVILAYENKNQMLQGVPVGTKVWRNQCIHDDVRHAFEKGWADDLQMIKMNGEVIGEKLTKEKYYLYYPQNIDVIATIQQELPNHQGVRNLVNKGVLRLVDQKDIKFMREHGYSAIDEWGDVDFKSWQEAQSFYCQDPVSREDTAECHYYVLEKPLAKLPPGLDGVYGIVVFVPDGIQPPYKDHTTSSIMRIHGTLKELNDSRAK